MNNRLIMLNSRNFQRGYKVTNPVEIPNLKIGFPKWLIDEEWKKRPLPNFPTRVKKEDFFKSEVYLQIVSEKLAIKQARKDLVLAKRASHNKSLDGLTYKQRRNKKRKDGKDNKLE